MNVKNTTTSSGLDQSLKIQTTDTQEVDRAGAGAETTWQSSNWPTYLGYYKSHIATKSVINKLGMWGVGKGFKADSRTTKILQKVKGWGKDTFNEVMDNQVRVKHINGDCYGEIITTDGEKIKPNGSNLFNLKPLNPGTMKHLINTQGMLTGYTQTNSDGSETPFDLEDIFHLVLNRTADEIHGTGDIESLTTFLDKIKQLDEDMAVMFHRFVVPLVIWSLNTDDPTAMATFKTQEKAAWNTGDNLIVPDTAVKYELLEAGRGVGKIINPMEWRNKWTEEVIKGGGVPALIMAIEAGTTEASSKMVYLAWQQVIEKEQRDIEAQVKAQLGLTIKYEFPARIEENLGEDEGKDGDINTGKKSEVKITTKKIND
ncbi:hypothetical protein LCGC14_0851830 [marine sediment metagenome]|uniref:Portal protein n=1 Tax=marine sediment metagenome TaxID=412755 RepID=A0A0F9RUM9_9ZZZZ